MTDPTTDSDALAAPRSGTGSTRARTIMVGGFLGAGKTTALLALAAELDRRGKKVGLITNDQSQGLVDTRLLGSRGFPVEEITGGCFCCRFNSFVEASHKLTRATRPDVLLAEPVGSCTDLRATVGFPLRRIYGDDFTLAPLSVLLDPRRALRVLGCEDGPSFSAKVLYVYRKQMEEAESLVINKVDQLDQERLATLRTALAEQFPQTPVFEISARRGDGLPAWFDHLLTAESSALTAPDIDYDIYAEGEAKLGWFNATWELDGDQELDGNALARELVTALGAALGETGLEVAHLKLTLEPLDMPGDLAVANLSVTSLSAANLAVANQVRSDAAPELSHELADPIEAARLIVNLRAEGEPERLVTLTEAAVAALADKHNLALSLEHREHFRPARPVPTHRMAEADAD